jgi:hypothetical protein
MTSIPAEARKGAAVRWSVGILFVCAAQVAMIYMLEDRQPVPPRRADAAPAARWIAGPPGEWLALQDPTLFALPHRQGFSGEAWLTIPSMEFQPAAWSEPVQYLPLQTNALGAGFKSFLARTAFPAFQTIRMPKPALRMPEVDSTLPVPARSTLRIEGGLAKRRLLSQPELPAWQDADLLTNSLVQLLVDARGNPVSAILLRSGASPAAKQVEADRKALELARAARFEPLKTASAGSPSAGLSVGTMIFEWQTVLVPATNAPAENP